jgi:serine/threonine protein kinase
MPPTSGRVIVGRYFLEEPLGQGGKDRVWRAHDRLLDRQVAVKEVVLPGAIDADPGLSRRARHAARTAARLSHPGIVTVYEVAEEDGRLWLVMELIPSRSLDDILSSEGPLAEPRVARTAQQLLAALTAAHAAGVLHTDVRPANVLIASGALGDDQDERAMLTDFGMAQFAGEPGLATADPVTGSHGFTAPEQLGGADATPASDLWSLGATLYAAVEGRLPSGRPAGPLAPFIAALMRGEPSAALAGPPAPRGDDPQPLLPPAPGRPAPAGEVFQEFAWTAAGDTQESAPRRSKNAPRRVRALTVVARAMVVVVALLAGGYLFREGEVSKHLSNTAPANPPPSALASPSEPAPSQEPTPPTASATPLPPISTAPGIVQAIDTSDAIPPSGYTRQSFSAAQLGTAAGFTIAAPPGWQSVPSEQDVKLEGPDGSFVEIDLSRHAKSDMVSEAEYLTMLRRPDFPGYQRIYSPQNQPLKKFIQPVTIRQTPGALWEFDWVTESSVQLREDVLLFALGRQSYTIYTAGPAGRHDNDWNLGTLGTVSTILRTFNPVLS